MRYYSVEVDGKTLYTSHPNGVNSPPDPGALQLEMDILAVPAAVAQTGSFVRMWGIPLQRIGQAADLNQKPVTIRGGMGKGLPLANPQQSGILVKGSINFAYGNWIGTDMTLDLVLAPPTTGTSIAATETPQNLALDWKANTPLKDALTNTLKQAFPKYQLDIQIKDIKLDHDQPGYYATLAQLADYVKGISKTVIGQNYAGVDIHFQEDKIIVRDGSVQSTNKMIQPADLIGQPTWIGPQEFQVTTVMRADIHPQDIIQLPKTLITSTANAAISTQNSAYRSSIAFTGTLTVRQVRHVGNFRNPDGRAWTSIFNCYTSSSPEGTGADGPTSAVLQPNGFSGLPQN